MFTTLVYIATFTASNYHNHDVDLRCNYNTCLSSCSFKVISMDFSSDFGDNSSAASSLRSDASRNTCTCLPHTTGDAVAGPLNYCCMGCCLLCFTSHIEAVFVLS